MTQETLLAAEVHVLAESVELVARRRAEGMYSVLIPTARDLASTLSILAEDAPSYLQPQIAVLAGRCNLILRSLTN